MRGRCPTPQDAALIKNLTRSQDEDPTDETYSVDETTVGGFSVGDEVVVVSSGFVGDHPNIVHIITGFIVSAGCVIACFEDISESGHADQSMPIRGLVRVHDFYSIS